MTRVTSVILIAIALTLTSVTAHGKDLEELQWEGLSGEPIELSRRVELSSAVLCYLANQRAVNVKALASYRGHSRAGAAKIGQRERAVRAIDKLTAYLKDTMATDKVQSLSCDNPAVKQLVRCRRYLNAVPGDEPRNCDMDAANMMKSVEDNIRYAHLGEL